MSAYNNEPGTGRTGYWEIPPNNYDFYTEDEKYKPVVQADGGILSSTFDPPIVQSEVVEAFACVVRVTVGYRVVGGGAGFVCDCRDAHVALSGSGNAHLGACETFGGSRGCTR